MGRRQGWTDAAESRRRTEARGACSVNRLDREEANSAALAALQSAKAVKALATCRCRRNIPSRRVPTRRPRRCSFPSRTKSPTRRPSRCSFPSRRARRFGRARRVAGAAAIGRRACQRATAVEALTATRRCRHSFPTYRARNRCPHRARMRAGRFTSATTANVIASDSKCESSRASQHNTAHASSVRPCRDGLLWTRVSRQTDANVVSVSRFLSQI